MLYEVITGRRIARRPTPSRAAPVRPGGRPTVAVASPQHHGALESASGRPEPGAIYRIEIGFRKENAIYPCVNNEENTEEDAVVITSYSIHYTKLYDEPGH